MREIVITVNVSMGVVKGVNEFYPLRPIYYI